MHSCFIYTLTLPLHIYSTFFLYNFSLQFYAFTVHVYIYVFTLQFLHLGIYTKFLHLHIYITFRHVYFTSTHLHSICLHMGPSIKYIMLFLTNFDLPLSHFVTHRGPPHKVRHIPEHPPKITRLQYALLNFVRSALISIESQLYCIVL